jgi:hypothetical protein
MFKRKKKELEVRRDELEEREKMMNSCQHEIYMPRSWEDLQRRVTEIYPDAPVDAMWCYCIKCHKPIC